MLQILRTEEDVLASLAAMKLDSESPHANERFEQLQSPNLAAALTSPAKLQLMDLPTEIRLEIYKHLLPFLLSLQMPTDRFRLLTQADEEVPLNHPLLRTCKQIYREFLPLYYRSGSWPVYMTMKHGTRFLGRRTEVTLCRRQSLRNYYRIKHLTVLFKVDKHILDFEPDATQAEHDGIRDDLGNEVNPRLARQLQNLPSSLPIHLKKLDLVIFIDKDPTDLYRAVSHTDSPARADARRNTSRAARALKLGIKAVLNFQGELCLTYVARVLDRHRQVWSCKILFDCDYLDGVPVMKRREPRRQTSLPVLGCKDMIDLVFNWYSAFWKAELGNLLTRKTKDEREVVDW